MTKHPPSRMTLADCATTLGKNLISARIPDPAVHIDEVVNHSK
jgi:hypothetical protein